ncbi:MAG: DUF3048 domain-containing protein [Actinomycetota bacterium]|nr:DUF3048 domain-containing protein [Actinomycetota bacterium]MDH5224725.1 DUF3048 domain-containing protein [Actinomycetota bacterium]MDH5313882.1 DUF3048 domain-containing protein [Actinomycetota bacterium]
MALTPRGKALVAGGAVVAVLGGGMAALALSGNAPDPIQQALSGIGVAPAPIEPCPLTGEKRPGEKQPPDRPLLAVKVENTPDAQPLAGLQGADIVYEEVVEGGITRFVLLFHCDEANRIGPVRSIRTTDPEILAPFSDHPLLAFSGGSKGVRNVVEEAGLTTMDESSAANAFARDEGRVAPHNLFTSTKPLWAGGKKLAKDESSPNSPFEYSDDVPTPNKKGRSATVVFSGLATAEWRWQKGHYVRYLDGSPMTLESGGSITADNVVIQVVKTTESDFQDVAGYPSPEVNLIGKGKAWVLRDGKLIVGKWERADRSEFTVFRTKTGEEITLTPGTTFVELAPTGMFDADISFG